MPTSNGYQTTDPYTEAQLIAMGAKNVSADPKIQTQAVSMLEPGLVTPGPTTGATPSGQGIASVPTQFQAATGTANAQNAAQLSQLQKTQAEIDAMNKADLNKSVGQAVAGYTDSNNVYHAPTTVQPTIGSVYGGTGTQSELDAAYDAQRKMIEDSLKPVDEQAIRENKLREFQTEIDALTNAYAEAKRREQGQQAAIGEGRLGTSAAIQARRGLIGSDFGTAQTNKIVDVNQQIQKDIEDRLNAERDARVQAILGKARSDAAEEIAAKQAARERGAKEYIDFLKGAAERKDKMVTDKLSALITLGQEPDDATLTELAKTLGVSVKDLKEKYDVAKVEYEAKNTKQDKFETVAPGSSIYKNGVLIGTAPNKPEDNKPIVEKFADNTTRQWNPSTQSWDLLASGTGNITRSTVTLKDGIYSISYDESGREVGRQKLGDTSPKPPTDAQFKAATYAERTRRASDLASQVESGFTGKISYGGKLLPNFLQGNDRQVFEQAKRDFISAKLRLESGAAIADSEYAKDDATFFPQPGDTQAIIDQKRAAREIVINGLKREAGSALEGSTIFESADSNQSQNSQYTVKIQEAQNAGYSSSDIVKSLSSDPSISQKIKDAQAAGYSPDEILQSIQTFSKPLSMGGKGSLSMKFESGGDPGAIGYDSTGGYSYGTFQLAHNNAKNFIDNSAYANAFKGIAFNSPEWRNKWKDVAMKDPSGFSTAQENYISKTHIEPQLARLQLAGLRVDRYSPALREVIASTAVQHGANTNVIEKALKSLPPNPPEDELIKSIYRSRWNGGLNFASSTPDVKKSVYNRFFGKNGELAQALQLSSRYS